MQIAHRRTGFVSTVPAALAITLALLLTPRAAQAQLFTFDPDGAGGANAPSVLSSLDWEAGNGLMGTPLPPFVGSTFQYYYQARLGNLIGSSGNPIVPPGLNATFEITVVASVTPVTTNVINAGPSFLANLAPAVVQSPNSFLEIWFDDTPDANALAGIGYNDGTRILLGGPIPSAGIGVFAIQTDSTLPFDLFGVNNYPSVTTFPMAGNLNVEYDVSSTDAMFFLSSASTMRFNALMATPFTQTDPSQFFVDQSGGAAPDVIPNLGGVNGGGSDFQIEDKSTSAFSATTAAPEPGCLPPVVYRWQGWYCVGVAAAGHNAGSDARIAVKLRGWEPRHGPER